jgi:serine/threonine-protein kinase RsbT
MIVVKRSESIPVKSQEDVVFIRQRVRAMAETEGFKLVDQTKLVTAASELARNTLLYGGGGTTLIESVHNDQRRGVRVTFEDFGPGIADIELAMKDGYTTGGGLGLGLSGAKRLSTEFSIQSQVGVGTKITIVRWR